MPGISSLFVDLCSYRIWELFPLGSPLGDHGHYILGDQTWDLKFKGEQK